MAEAATTVEAGRRDLARAQAALAARIPEPLAPLARLAFNYWWSWTPGGPELFGRRPLPLAGSPATPCDCCWRRRARPRRPRPTGTCRARRRAGGAPGADRDRPAADWPASPEQPVAFLCAEYGVHRSLPIYSGGLGAWPATSSRRPRTWPLPLVAVGLLYHQGYFHQRVDTTGWQHEYWVDTDPERLPAALVTGDDGVPLRRRVPLARRDVRPRSGGSTSAACRCTCSTPSGPRTAARTDGSRSRLYVGDRGSGWPSTRCWASAACARSRALGIDPAVVHLNEGHAAFAPLELAARRASAGRASRRRSHAPPAHRLHHPHARPGRQRDLHRRRAARGPAAIWPRSSALDVEALLRPGRARPRRRRPSRSA